MGSLMSGWDSRVKDHNSVKRCKSLTREEIEAFWKLKKKNEEEHVQAVSKVAQEVLKSHEEEKKVVQDPFDVQNKRNAWWRRSNLAFLNEPREAEGRPNNYVPQFDVAHIAKIAEKY